MHDAHEFLRSLAIVLCVAAVTTVIFQRLRQPVVFGYLLAGLIIGQHTPIPLVVNEGIVQTLAEMGVIMLMFGLGLEFSLRKLIAVSSTAGVVALVQSSAMVWFGYLIGQAFGWSSLESVYAGAVIAISSTTIIVKAFQEQNAKGRFTQIVFGVLIIEDLIGIFLIAILTAVSAGSAVSAESLGRTAGQLLMFLAGLIGIGLLVIPRLIRAIVKLGKPETTLVASIGICFAAALLALNFGYSVALGAFIAGSLVAESGHDKAIEHLVAPVRDVFAAIFFVAVGLMINPLLVVEHWKAVVVFSIVVILGKIVAVTLGSFLTGYNTRTSVQTGMSLAQIGEFSFIIAGVGLATGATGSFLYPIAVAVSAITTLTTPWLIKAAGPTAEWVDRKLPARLQTFVTLYGSWIERLRSAPDEERRKLSLKRPIQLIVLDAVLLIALVIGISLQMELLVDMLTSAVGSAKMARWVVLAAGSTVAVPLLIGIARSARLLGTVLASRALPNVDEGKLDIAAAPRTVLIVTLQLAILAVIAIPLLAITQPFLPPLRGSAILVPLIGVLGIAFWRSTANLHGHTRAGAQVIVSTLAQQMADSEEPESGGQQSLAKVNTMLPGLGEPVPVKIGTDSYAVGRTLAQLNLRGITGAMVLAITHGDEQIVLPIGGHMVSAGDILALAGTDESVAAAKKLLNFGPQSIREEVEVDPNGDYGIATAS